jgi:hypothetical protein
MRALSVEAQQHAPFDKLRAQSDAQAQFEAQGAF